VGGNTNTGLVFGMLAFLAMIWTWLLSARKRATKRQLGTVSFWLKGHIWIGLLSVPLVFFHTGFQFGGTLEQILMGIFLLVIASGLLGQLIQQYIPRFMTASLDKQAIPEQVDNVVSALQSKADGLVVAVCGTLFDSVESESPSQIDAIRRFHLTHVRPFMDIHPPSDSVLINSALAASVFATQKQSVSVAHRELLDELFDLCDERRQLLIQRKWHAILHYWTFLHIPISFSLLVLVIIHILTALYY